MNLVGMMVPCTAKVSPPGGPCSQQFLHGTNIRNGVFNERFFI